VIKTASGPDPSKRLFSYPLETQPCRVAALLGSLDGSVGAVDIAGAREIAPVGRTQSERRRRLALAGGFRRLILG